MKVDDDSGESEFFASLRKQAIAFLKSRRGDKFLFEFSQVKLRCQHLLKRSAQQHVTGERELNVAEVLHPDPCGGAEHQHDQSAKLFRSN